MSWKLTKKNVLQSYDGAKYFAQKCLSKVRSLQRPVLKTCQVWQAALNYKEATNLGLKNLSAVIKKHPPGLDFGGL